jgi:hypothetical protein
LHKKKLSPWEESKETFMLAKAFPKKDDFDWILACLIKMHVFKDWLLA